MEYKQWACTKCAEQHSNRFLVCWRCGTTIDGVEDPHFSTIDDSDEAPYTPQIRRLNVRTLLALVAAVVIAFALIRFGGVILSSFVGTLIASILYAMHATPDIKQRMVLTYLCFLLLLLPVVLLVLGLEKFVF